MILTIGVLIGEFIGPEKAEDSLAAGVPNLLTSNQILVPTKIA